MNLVKWSRALGTSMKTVSRSTLSYSSLQRTLSILPWVLQIMAHMLIGPQEPWRYHPWIKQAKHIILCFLCILNTRVYSILPPRNTLSLNDLVNSTLSDSGLSLLLIETILSAVETHDMPCSAFMLCRNYLTCPSQEPHEKRQGNEAYRV